MVLRRFSFCMEDIDRAAFVETTQRGASGQYTMMMRNLNKATKGERPKDPERPPLLQIFRTDRLACQPIESIMMNRSADRIPALGHHLNELQELFNTTPLACSLYPELKQWVTDRLAIYNKYFVVKAEQKLTEQDVVEQPSEKWGDEAENIGIIDETGSAPARDSPTSIPYAPLPPSHSRTPTPY